jgi:hypothetical protein
MKLKHLRTDFSDDHMRLVRLAAAYKQKPIKTWAEQVLIREAIKVIKKAKP